MLSKTLAAGTWLCIFIVAFASQPVWLQKPPKHKMPAELKAATCCKEVKELKAQVANLSSTLSKLSKKQESDWVSVVMQVMELESSSKRLESRLTDAESKFSEMNSQIDIMQLQAAQTVTQTSAGKEVTHTPPPLHSSASRQPAHQDNSWGLFWDILSLEERSMEQLFWFLMFCKCAQCLPRSLALPFQRITNA